MLSYQGRYSRRKQAELADIGSIPTVVDLARREACRLDLHRFLRTYFPASTGLWPFGEAQRRMITRIERCCLEGGRYANVIFRGSAKTSISECAAIWGGLFGHRRFIVIFGNDEQAASDIVDSMKVELFENELLLEDFPEVCHAIRALDNKPQRCKSQTHVPGAVEGYEPAEGTNPELTHIEWSAGKIVFPRIVLPDGPARSSGVAIRARGMTGSFLGMKHQRFDGVKQRPDFLLLDDPQSPETASTDLQVSKRLRSIKNGILRLGGHDRSMAVVMNATPLAHDDLVERLIDPARNPSWQSDRSPMVTRMPAALDSLWLGEYARIRNAYDREIVGDQKRAHHDATEFYRQHREEMDAGAEVAWSECYYRETEISALQHAINILIDEGEEAFSSQCQCQPPKPLVLGSTDDLTADQIARTVNTLAQGVVPANANVVTAFVDVGDNKLHFAVGAFDQHFTGAFIGYGSYPAGRKTISQVHQGVGIEAAVYAALQSLVSALLSREWCRDDGTRFRIEKCGIDSGHRADVCHKFCRESPHASTLVAAKGFAIGAKSPRPFDMRVPKPGEKQGESWYIGTGPGGRRLLMHEGNHWKNFLFARLATAPGDPGCISLYGKDLATGRAADHSEFARHLKAEYRTLVVSSGRSVWEWKQKPEPNHLLDAAVGTLVMASLAGCSLMGKSPRKSVRRKSWSELQREKMHNRRAG